MEINQNCQIQSIDFNFILKILIRLGNELESINQLQLYWIPNLNRKINSNPIQIGLKINFFQVDLIA